MSDTVEIEVPAAEVRERLVAFMEEVVGCLSHPAQRENALVYTRGLLEHGGRKSLQPTLFRMQAPSARYESVQQFLADSPWDGARLVRAVSEHLAPQVEFAAWVIDDTGFVKDGKSSPGVKRQYSGTLGKVANCQIGVSLHAVGFSATQPLGFSLYLPEEWCADDERRRKAKVPDEVTFKTKHDLAADLIEEAASWDIQRVPVLADQAYGDSTAFRTRLDTMERPYLLSVGPTTGLFPAETVFSVPKRRAKEGRTPSRLRPDREHESAEALAHGLSARSFQTITFSTGPRGTTRTGRFGFARVIAAHPVREDHQAPREEWLIVEWPNDEKAPTNYWLSNLPPDTPATHLAQLARLRWIVELDYRQLKGELGLDHYEGRSYAGWHHHCALVICAHAFLTLERLRPKARRPA